MAQILKQSTAVDVLIGPFVDRTDGYTAEASESPTVKLSKNGQTLAAKNDVTTPVHDADGYYNCELDATDTNTVGTLILTVAASANALPVRHEFQVIEEDIYNALYGASATGFDANGRVDVGEWLGTAVTSGTGGPDVNVNAISDSTVAATNAEIVFDTDFITNYNTTTNAWVTNYTDTIGTIGNNDCDWVDANNRVDVGSWLGTAVTVTVAGIPRTEVVYINAIDVSTMWSATSSRLQVDVLSISDDTVAANNCEAWFDGTGYASTNSTINQVTGSVGSVTGNVDGSVGSVVGSVGSNLELGPTEVNAQVDTALADIGLDHLISSALPTNWATDVAAGSVFDNIADDGTAVYDRTTDSLQAIADSGGGGPTAGQIADAVWDETLTTSNHNGANSAGKRLRQIDAAFIVTEGTAQAGATNTITLAAGESSTNDIFRGDRIQIIAGTGVGEHGIVTAYNGTSKVATMSEDWVVTPDATSEYILVPADVDVETWSHTKVTISTTTAKPEVDTMSVGDQTASATAGISFDRVNNILSTADSSAVVQLALTNYPVPLIADISANTQAVVGTLNDLDTAGVSATVQTVINTLNDPSLADISANTQAIVDGLVDLTTADVSAVVQLVIETKPHLNTANAKQVVVDALSVDEYPLPGQEAPSATASLATMIAYRHKQFRNRETMTSTTYSLYADDGTTVDQKATVSDDGTTSDKGEIGTGP